MLKIYLDNCCYCRPFDDLCQQKNNLEVQAIKFIISKCSEKKLEIYKSDALYYELSNIKNKKSKSF